MLAFHHKTAVSMETVDLKLEDGRPRATRSCYGGNARAELTWKAPLQIATVKAKASTRSRLTLAAAAR
jgi:electron transfer flavoprotein alpha subunit